MQDILESRRARASPLPSHKFSRIPAMVTMVEQQREQEEPEEEEEIPVERSVLESTTVSEEDLGDVELQEQPAATTTTDGDNDNDDATHKSSQRLLLRQQVLAEIFPPHTEHQSIRFDVEANQYVAVDNKADDDGQPEETETDDNGAQKRPKTSPGSIMIDDAPTADSPPPATAENEAAEHEEEEGDNNNNKNEDEDDDILTCSICLDPLRATDSKVSAAKCSHIYHCDCLMEWMLMQQQQQNSRRRGDRAGSTKQHDSCPTCRTELWDAQVYKQLEVDVADRLGVNLEDLADNNNNASSEPWIVEEGILSGRYVQWGLSSICCCTFLLYIIASVLVPSLTSGVRRWW